MEELVVDFDYIIEQVALIEGEKEDPESAHVISDNLWRDVLTAIANGAENAAELAGAALQVDAIEYPRWYA